MLRVVFDTNVIVSALLVDKGLPAMLFDLALDQKIQLCYSPALLAEYQEVLNRPRFNLSKPAIEKALHEIRQVGLEVFPKQTITLLTRDPQDNRILEASLEAKADYIITGNKRHFPETRFKKTRIVTPREFMDREETQLMKIK